MYTKETFFSTSSSISLIADGPHPILPVDTKDLPTSPRFTPPYKFLSRCKFSTPTTRQPMVEFYCIDMMITYCSKNSQALLVASQLLTVFYCFAIFLLSVTVVSLLPFPCLSLWSARSSCYIGALNSFAYFYQLKYESPMIPGLLFVIPSCTFL